MGSLGTDEIERELQDLTTLAYQGLKARRTIHALRWVLGMEPRSVSFEIHNPPRLGVLNECVGCGNTGVLWWQGIPRPCPNCATRG